MHFPLNSWSLPEQLVSLFSTCHRICSREEFCNELYRSLKTIIPHAKFYCCIADRFSSSILSSICIAAPNEEASDGKFERFDGPAVKHWLGGTCPAYFDVNFSDASSETKSTWSNYFERVGAKNMAVHGMREMQGGYTSYFSFSDIDVWNDETSQLLRMVVPHLHVALFNQYLSRNVADNFGISEREREVLKLVCIGKTNPEIGMLLGISSWTVKIHVKNFMSKLAVSTRGHAAVKAMTIGLVNV